MVSRQIKFKPREVEINRYLLHTGIETPGRRGISSFNRLGSCGKKIAYVLTGSRKELQKRVIT